MRKAERLFQIVNLLRARQPLSAAMLAEELAVSVRSIYRYMDDLSVTGIPVYGEPGVGYRLDNRCQLPPLTLSNAERDALLLGMQMVATSTGSEFSRAARSLQAKIDAALPEQRVAEHQQWVHALTVGTTEDVGWDRLQQAVSGQRIVELVYRDAQGRTSQRRVWPLGLFYWGGKWTLGAWCELRQQFRDFRLDRMDQLALPGDTFTITEEIGLPNYMRLQAQQWQALQEPH